jgi:hypothetical protein
MFACDVRESLLSGIYEKAWGEEVLVFKRNIMFVRSRSFMKSIIGVYWGFQALD